jgi:hypothetical protein
VTEDDRHRHTGFEGFPLALRQVHVAVAGAAGFDAHQHLAGERFGRRHLV